MLQAFVRGCFVCVIALALCGGLWAQTGPDRGRTIPDVWPLAEKEVDAYWRDFRAQRPAGTYAFSFDLRHMPRRGSGPHYKGMLFGTMTPDGPMTRVVLMDGDLTQEYLLRGGADPELWAWTAEDGLVTGIEGAALEPLIDDVLYTPFDLFMPFLYWDDYEYVGTERIRGRPAHLFDLKPPADDDAYEGVGKISVAVDSQFDALLRVRMYDSEDQLVRSFNMLNFRRVDDRWIVRSVDLLDESSRDKTRFQVSGVAFDSVLPDEMFTAEALGEDLPVVDLKSVR